MISRGKSRKNRRQFLASLAVCGTLRAALKLLKPGANLYTVRRELKRNPDQTLRAISDIGYTEVHGYSRPDMAVVAPKMRQHGLTPVSCEIEPPLITANWDPYPELRQISLEDAIAGMKEAGVEYLVMGYIPPGARGDADDFFRRTADRMNVVGELCRKNGLKFAWRNHAFEFQGRPGQRPVDIYRERLDPKLVTMELDVFWASVAARDPLEMLKQFKGRISLVNLSDKAKDTPVQFSEALGQGAFVETGKGVIDFPAIMKAAAAVKVAHCFTGLDETPGDPIESLRASFRYFQAL